MFSGCPFVRSFVCPSVRLQNLWTQYFANGWIAFDVNWHKWFTGKLRAWNDQVCGSGTKKYEAAEVDLEAWRRQHSRPPSVEYLFYLYWWSKRKIEQQRFHWKSLFAIRYNDEHWYWCNRILRLRHSRPVLAVQRECKVNRICWI